VIEERGRRRPALGYRDTWMTRMRTRLWRTLAISVVTLPLLHTSCVELIQRSAINGLFDAATPLLDQCLEERLDEASGTGEEP